MRDNYMMIGATPDKLTLAMPWIAKSSVGTATEPQVAWVKVVSGETKGRKMYRSKYIPTPAWPKIAAEEWWRINRWFEENGYIFWARYFNQSLGTWQTRKFRYLGCSEEASDINPDTHMPSYYYNASISIEDAGGQDADG